MSTEPLELRTSAMLDALKLARAAVPGVGELDPELGGRFEPRFAQLAGKVEDGLVQKNGDVDELLALGEELVAETLAFLGGAAARRFRLDRGVTSLAGAWLDQLSDVAQLEQVSVVIPSSTEFAGMLTQVIRLRLPSDGIWALPVAAHEYGHFVASVFTRRERRDSMQVSVVPVEDLLHTAATKRELPRLYWHGHELFADAFAAAIAGPAYTYYCAHYRFLAAGAQEVTPTHPEPARRIRLQLAVLEKLAANEADGYLAADAQKIRTAWTDRLAAAGVDADPEDDPLLDAVEPRLLDLLDDPKLRAMRYRGHLAAHSLAADMLDDKQEAGSVPTALNAAWVRRLRDHATSREDIGAIAEACERMVKGALGHG
jgi:hypothetical protein